MTEIEVYQPPAALALAAERDIVDGWLAVASDIIKLANVIASTEFVPAEYRDNPPAVAAAILAGRELGIGPMTSLRHVQIVKGTPTLSAEYKRARVLAAGHEFDILELNTTRCKVSGRRKGSNKPPLEITFTMDDARIAGLIKDKGAWKTRPRRMLFARAGSELCDFLFSDIVNGLLTAEVVAEGVDGDEFAGYDEAPAQASPAPAPRTAQRRQRAAAPPPADRPTTAAPAAATAPTAGPAPAQTAPPGLPPLPGEDDEPDPTEPANGAHIPPIPGDAPATAAPSDRASSGQRGSIHQHFRRLGFDDDERPQRLVATAVIAGIGGQLASTNDLTQDQAKTVIDTLARCRDRERLIVLLAAGDKPQPEDGAGA